MADKEEKSTKKKKKRSKGFLHSLFLFVCVFMFAFGVFFFLAKSYSPDVDVSIGNNESLTLGEEDLDVEIKSVDERLKWIQMEDEMPSVAVRNPNKDIDINNFTIGYEDLEDEKANENIKTKKDETVKNPPKPSLDEVLKSKEDFRAVPPAPKQVIPLPTKQQINPEKSDDVQLPSVPLITKVYLGQYQTLEEAMSVQEKISKDISDTAPFIKAINDHYIVQLGSFTDKSKADSFITRLKEKGYSPKTLTNN